MEMILEHLSDRRVLLWGGGVFSLVALIVSALILPHLILRLPADYFMEKQPSELAAARSRLAYLKFIARNALALLLVFAGILMLFLPGQGILTIFAGLCLSDFPGKHRLARRMLRLFRLLTPLNRFRKKHGEPPFADL